MLRYCPYPRPPGSGPAGKTCKTCARHEVLVFSRRYHKCRMTSTHSAASDIRVSSPACEFYYQEAGNV